MELDWNHEALEQLTFHWNVHVRPRLDGLTDDEYFWEPVPHCWSIRRRGESTAPIALGGGEMVAEFELPEPDVANDQRECPDARDSSGTDKNDGSPCVCHATSTGRDPYSGFFGGSADFLRNGFAFNSTFLTDCK